MVDPLSIIAAFCTIIRSLHALYHWWQRYQAKQTTAKSSQNTAIENELMGGFVRIWSRYNRIASIMGRGFQLNLNETLMKDLKLLRPKLKRLQLQQKELEFTKIDLAQDQKGQDQTRERVTWLAKYTQGIQEGAEDVLRKLSAGIILANKDIEAMENEQLKAKYPPRAFCDGAKIFQSGNKDDDYLSTLVAAAPSRTNWGYICKSCGLEVGYYPAVRISCDGKALDSSILLTASHLVVCRSIQNRRAFYRCLACYKKHKLVDFPSAVAFEKHMERHLNFTLIKKQDVDWKENKIIEKEREFMDGIKAEEYEPEKTFAEDVSLKGSGAHQYTEPVDLPHQFNSPKADRQVGYQAEDVLSETFSLKEDGHRSVHSKVENPITPQTSPGTTSQSQPLGHINATIAHPASNLIPKSNIAIEPEYWVLRDGEYCGYGVDREVLKVQREIPFDSWIRSDQRHPREKYMYISSKTGEVMYHPGRSSQSI